MKQEKTTLSMAVQTGTVSRQHGARVLRCWEGLISTSSGIQHPIWHRHHSFTKVIVLRLVTVCTVRQNGLGMNEALIELDVLSTGEDRNRVVPEQVIDRINR